MYAHIHINMRWKKSRFVRSSLVQYMLSSPKCPTDLKAVGKGLRKTEPKIGESFPT
jgi:hypothetical protein